MADGQTLPLVDTDRLDGADLLPWLFVLFRRDRIMEPSARYRLDRDVVVIGRGRRGCTRTRVEMSLGIDDPWMSSVHARLVRDRGRWRLEDAGSRNGAARNGEPVMGPINLEDGDIIELGRTFLLFRASVTTPRDQLDLDDEAAATSFGKLRTLSLPFAGELAALARVAATDISIVIAGASGTGKEVIARAIHELSSRSGPFLAVNCAALPDTIVQSELFGHKKGAFSGAVDDRSGLVRSAHRGTLLLDELGDLGAAGQGALLRVLQEHEVTPLGESRPVRVDVRVLAATHRDLDSLAATQAFRTDLLARLSGFVFRVPPLRERREDFGLVLRALVRAAGAPSVALGQDAARRLLAYEWPLNIRELEKCIVSAIAQTPDNTIQTTHLPERVREARPAPPERTPAPITTPEDRRARLVALLDQNGGNISEVARAMNTARAQIHRWLRKYEIDPASFRR
jgi:sigma-54 dependent transcriptional regulator, acetoin dehydrogenase operon transcriptional activator AcoR